MEYLNPLFLYLKIHCKDLKIISKKIYFKKFFIKKLRIQYFYLKNNFKLIIFFILKL